MLPKLITFDESTGCALTAQDEESEIKAEATTPQLRLPWRAWHAHASGFGRQEAAMRCALQVLHMLHVNQVYDDMPIDILFDETKNTKHVVATGVIPAESILLPPCVPKCKHLSAESVRPHRVAITVTVMSRVPVAEPESSGPGIRRQRVSQKMALSAVAEKAAGASASAGPTEGEESALAPAVAGSRKSFVPTFYVVPEWLGPRSQLADDCDSDDTETKPEWTWCGDESMHPYWAIRRQTGTVTNWPRGTKPEQPCNMKFKEFAYTCVAVGSMRGTSVTTTAEVTIPFLTNEVEIPRGAELLLQVEEKTQQKKHKNRNWKDQLAEDTRKQQRVAAPKHGVGKATSSGKSLVDLEV